MTTTCQKCGYEKPTGYPCAGCQQNLIGNAEFVLSEWLILHDEECRVDHHGRCQTHFLEINCIVLRTKELVKKLQNSGEQ
jgi:hypothetical protein